jgi:cysteine sulfinate desulfinase/cysteine desulfurase-like protein
MTTTKRPTRGKAPKALDGANRGIDSATTVEEGIAALSEALSAANERLGRLEDLVMSLEKRLIQELTEALRAGTRTRPQR